MNLNRLSSIIVLTQLTGAIFAVFAFVITMAYSTVSAPGGSLLDVLAVYGSYRLPLAVIGGLFIVLVLASIGLYANIKLKPRVQ
jgi:hypothetical protein